MFHKVLSITRTQRVGLALISYFTGVLYFLVKSFTAVTKSLKFLVTVIFRWQFVSLLVWGTQEHNLVKCRGNPDGFLSFFFSLSFAHLFVSRLQLLLGLCGMFIFIFAELFHLFELFYEDSQSRILALDLGEKEQISLWCMEEQGSGDHWCDGSPPQLSDKWNWCFSAKINRKLTWDQIQITSPLKKRLKCSTYTFNFIQKIKAEIAFIKTGRCCGQGKNVDVSHERKQAESDGDQRCHGFA